jgi:hypothetical protein
MGATCVLPSVASLTGRTVYPHKSIHTLLAFKHHGKFFSTSSSYIFPKFWYQSSLCGPYFLQILEKKSLH